MAELVRLELGDVAHLELNNPPMNLITDDVLAEFEHALATLEQCAPGDVRAVVVTAAVKLAVKTARKFTASIFQVFDG